MARATKFFPFFILLLLVLPALVISECTCDNKEEDGDKAKALKYKIIAIATIVITSAIGVLTPFLGKFIPALSPEKDIFFIIKAFAAGVILSTGFIHVLPEAFDRLTSPCLDNHPWGEFSFTGFVAMCAAMATLMVDTFATSYFKKHYAKNIQVEAIDVEKNSEHGDGRVHVHDTHTNNIHCHTHGLIDSFESSQLLRHRVISQVIVL